MSLEPSPCPAQCSCAQGRLEQGIGLTGLWELASSLLFSFREAAAVPANIYTEKTGFNLPVLGKEDADGVKGVFATR